MTGETADHEPLPDQEEEEAELRPFRIQLAAVHAAELAGRVEASAGGPEVAPAIEPVLLRTPLSEDRRGFSCRLQLRIRLALADKATSISLTVQGDFRSPDPIPEGDFEAFVAYTPVALLWPYARAYADQLHAMLGVQAAPLPTLDALNIVMGPEEPSSEERA